MMTKRAELMSFYGWTEDYVMFGLTGAKAWTYYAYAVENRASAFGNNIKRTTDGYLDQEVKRILAEKKK